MASRTNNFLWLGLGIFTVRSRADTSRATCSMAAAFNFSELYWRPYFSESSSMTPRSRSPSAASVREIRRANWASVRLCHTHRKLHHGINTARPAMAVKKRIQPTAEGVSHNLSERYRRT